MDSAEALKNISKIIQREDKTSTYKYALLRGTIEIVQENSPFLRQEEGRVYIPTGLLVEKWLYYYYPLFRSDPHVRQIKSSVNLAFGPLFRTVVGHYERQGSISKLRSELHGATIPVEILPALTDLLKKLQETITLMPMKHLGQSLRGQHYEVFQKEMRRTNLQLSLGIASVIDHLGTFSIPLPYFEAFSVYGSFISGQDSILIQWAQLTEAFSSQQYKTSQVLEMLSTAPVTERQTSAAQSLFLRMHRDKQLGCVWTGKTLEKWDVDHLIPFSVWKNNDLWNMLPCDSGINAKKSDSIPDLTALNAAKQRIIAYWRAINDELPHQFPEEIRLALLGAEFEPGWEEAAFDRLSKNCQQLIEQRGHNPWKP